jgi:Zn-dependent protease
MFSLDTLLSKIPLLIPVIFSLTLHELAHGLSALHFGDPTAKRMGRLSLNPLRHLDPLGTLAMLFFYFGWAKPVPVDPRYLRNPRRDMVWIAAAGPATNVVLALIFALILHIPGLLDVARGSAVMVQVFSILLYAFLINVVLAAFNLLPIPGLDGGRVLEGLLPFEAAYQFAKAERFMFLILFVVILSGGFQLVLKPVLSLAVLLLPAEIRQLVL